MKVKEIVKITSGRLVGGNPEKGINPSKISTDSRTIKKGEFFLALKGPNFDGSDFVNAAFDKGAFGAIITDPGPSKPWNTSKEKTVIAVSDTAKALHNIAHFHRMSFDIPVIGVTGSSGKTTIKEMIWKTLSSKYTVLKNEGTRNNHIGLPQTLLKLDSSYDICVVELGTNHPGEITFLSRIASPTIAIIANIGPVHLEFLRDMKGVFNAKWEITKHLARSNPLILNGDDPFLRRINTKRFDIIKFGFGDGNDFRASGLLLKRGGISFMVNGRWRFELKILGVHNVLNALAAIATASYFKVPYAAVRKSLLGYEPAYLRLNIKRIKGVTIINDSYNSNPPSMGCALDALKNYPARSRWVVSADMLELGDHGKHFHKMVGKIIARSGMQGLLTLGELSKYTYSEAKRCGMDSKKVRHCHSHEEISDMLMKMVKRGDVVLVKGSRAMKMEEVVERLKNEIRV